MGSSGRESRKVTTVTFSLGSNSDVDLVGLSNGVEVSVGDEDTRVGVVREG